MGEWLLLHDGWIVYLLIFLFLLGGAIGLPIPEDIPLIISGILVQAERADLKLIALVCYTGILLGDMLIFGIGRWLGPAVFQKEWFKSRISTSKIRRMRINLERRSLLMIFLARHLFYLRSITFLTCGAVKMRATKFLLADAVAALISVPIVLGVGYLAAEHYQTALEFMNRAKEFTLLLALLAICFYFWKRRRDRKQDQQGGNPAP